VRADLRARMKAPQPAASQSWPRSRPIIGRSRCAGPPFVGKSVVGLPYRARRRVLNTVDWTSLPSMAVFVFNTVVFLLHGQRSVP
jgi:hypothetical protein